MTSAVTGGTALSGGVCGFAESVQAKVNLLFFTRRKTRQRMESMKISVDAKSFVDELIDSIDADKPASDYLNSLSPDELPGTFARICGDIARASISSGSDFQTLVGQAYEIGRDSEDVYFVRDYGTWADRELDPYLRVGSHFAHSNYYHDEPDQPFERVGAVGFVPNPFDPDQILIVTLFHKAADDVLVVIDRRTGDYVSALNVDADKIMSVVGKTLSEAYDKAYLAYQIHEETFRSYRTYSAVRVMALNKMFSVLQDLHSTTDNTMKSS